MKHEQNCNMPFLNRNCQIKKQDSARRDLREDYARRQREQGNRKRGIIKTGRTFES